MHITLKWDLDHSVPFWRLGLCYNTMLLFDSCSQSHLVRKFFCCCLALISWFFKWCFTKSIFLLYMILVRHLRLKWVECKVENHLDLLVGFLNNHPLLNGTTSSIFWIHSWAAYVQIMYVIYFCIDWCHHLICALLFLSSL